MATLANCIGKHSPKDDLDHVTQTVEAKRKKLGELESVEAVLKDLAKERKDIVAQIEKALGLSSDKSVTPKEAEKPLADDTGKGKIEDLGDKEGRTYEGFNFSKNNIPLQLAYDAHSGSSFSPDKRAKQEQDGYVTHMQNVIDELIKYAKTDEQKGELRSWFNEYYKPGYLKRQIDLLRANSRTISSMITGPSNFPTARNQKRLNVAHKRMEELIEWDKTAQSRMESKLRGNSAISSTDPEATAKLQKKLDQLEKNHKIMKDANLIVRNKISDAEKVSKLVELGLSEKNAKDALVPDYSGGVGFPSYALTNNNANIKRVKERLAGLKKRAEKAVETGGTETKTFEGGSVELNHGDGFLRIYHNEKPSRDVRQELKSNGFHWSPTDGAWRRKLTYDAKRKAENITGIKFSKTTEPTTGTSISELPRWQQRIVKLLEKSGKVFLSTNAEVIQALEDAGLSAKYSEDEKLQGVTLPDGTVHIIPENIKSGKLWGVFAHEIGVHVGRVLQTKPGFQSLLKSIESRMNEQSKTGEAIRNAEKLVPKDTGLRAGEVYKELSPERKAEVDALRREETLAYLVRDANDVGIVRRFIAMVKRALVEMGLDPKVFTVDDFAAMAEAAVRKEANQSEGNLNMVGVNQFAQDAKMSIERAKRKIQGLDAFKKWFSGSKVVDENGEPLVVYHGSYRGGEIDQFRKMGKDEGFYFTKDHEYASKYSNGTTIYDKSKVQPSVYPVFINLKNPFITSKGSESHFLTKERMTALKDKGYDGIVYGPTLDTYKDIPEAISRSTEIIAFEPTQIKSIYNRGTWDGTNPDIMMSVKEAAKAIYSKLEQVASIDFTGMKAQGVLNFLNKKGVKKAEIEAIGLDAWIASKKHADKVTREELLDFVRANMVEVEDVVLKGKREGEMWSDLRDSSNFLGNKKISISQRLNGKWYAWDGDKKIEVGGPYLDRESAKTETTKLLKLKPPKYDNTHFKDYTEPNANPGSYREMFVTAPKMPSLNNDSRKKFGKDYMDLSLEEMQLLKEEPESIPWQDGHSQYSEIKNPVVRIRFNTETRDGKTYLRIEEMQGPSPENQKKMPAYLKDNIYNLGVKRILAHAKEQGFDGVVFAQKEGMSAGETQADRYSLEKQVDDITWRVRKGNKQVQINLTNGDGLPINIDGSGIVTQKGHDEATGDQLLVGKPLSDIIGKEVAKKIIEKESGSLSGEGLKIGGTGLKNLYDNQLPKMLEAYSKEKFTDGVLPITDKTPESFPLFAKSSPFKKVTQALVNSAAFKYWFGKSAIKNGKSPVILFHGTPHNQFLSDPDYDWTFDTTRQAKPDSSPFAGLGIFLGNETIATGHAGAEGTVHPFFVKVENPLIITSDELAKKVTDVESARLFKKRTQELGGHDGIIIKDRGQVIVFDSGQLKSAELNTGEFSSEIKDVRYSKATKAYDKAVIESMGTITEKVYSKQDLPIWKKILSSPEYYFRDFPAVWKMFQAQMNRHKEKFNLEHSILGDFVPFMKDMQKKFLADYDKAKSYLLSVDKSGKSFNINHKQRVSILNPAGQSVGYVKTQLEASKLISTDAKLTGNDRKAYKDKKVDLWTVFNPEGKELGQHEDEQAAVKQMTDAESKWLKEKGYSEKSVNIVSRFRGMTNSAFDHMIRDMRKVMNEIKALGVEEPTVDLPDEANRWAVLKDGTEVGTFGTESDAWDAIEAMDKAARATNTASPKLTVSKKKDSEITKPVKITELIARMADLRGSYFPRQRRSGGVILRAVNGKEKIMEPYDLYAYGRQSIDGETGEVKQRPASAFIRKAFNKATGHIPFVDTLEKRARALKRLGYTITIEKDTSTPETIFEPMHLMASSDAMFQEAINRAKNKGQEVDPAAIAEMSKVLAGHIADIFKGRGFLSSRMKRTADYWKGFEEDPLLAGTQYARGVSSGIAKRDAAKAMIAAVTGRDVSWYDWKENNPDGKWDDYNALVEEKRLDPKLQPQMYKEAMDWMQEMLRNDEQVDRIVGTLKGLAVLKFLGFRVSSAMVNATNMVMAVPATISSEAKSNIPRALNAIRRAASQYYVYRRDSSKLSVEDRDIFQTITNNGWDEAQFNQENASVLMTKLGRGWAKFGEVAMGLFGGVEKANRATTIFAAYKELIKNTSLSKEDALIKAKDISDLSHGTYGKATLPSWIRGNNLLKLPFTFQKFNQNYVLNMSRMGMKGDYGDMAYMMLSPAILGGVSATLVAPLAFAVLGKMGVGGDDPEEEFYAWVRRTFGSDEIARHGLPGMAGISLKGSLEMHNPFPRKLSELMGAPGALFTDTHKAVKHFGKGELLKGAEDLLPTAIGSPIKAYREGKEGVTTESYGSIFYGKEPLKANTSEQFIRALSFSPSRISGIREKQFNEKEVASKYAAQKKEITEQLKRYYLFGDGNYAELVKEWRHYNDLVKGSGRRDIPYLTQDGVRQAVRNARRPTKTERLRTEV